MYLFGSVGLGDPTAIAVCTAAVAAFFGLMWYLLGRSFLAVATATGAGEKVKYTAHREKQHSAASALLKKEFGRLISSANYMLNCALSTLLIPALGVLMLVRGSVVVDVLRQTFGGAEGAVTVLFAAALCMSATMNDTTASSVSLEGRSIWIPQSLPVDPWQVLRAKLRVQLILTMPALLFCSVCGLVLLRPPVAEALALVVLPQVFALFFALLGLTLNLKRPSLQWTNELSPIKQSLPVTVEFTFGGTAIPVGATEVEVRGESGARKKITAKEFKDLVRYCPELKSLVFDYCDLEGENQIGRLTELKKLEIMSCNLQDISFVEGLTKLTRLNVCHNRLFDLSAIEDLPLTFLNIADNPDLGNSDLRTVGRVTTLDTLYIYSLDISSLSPLKNLKRLYTLNVNNDSRITEEDLSDLYRITGLRKLQINGTGVTSLDFLFEDFPGLKELEARKMKKLVDPIVSFLGLAQHSNLTKLTISKDLKESMDEDANTAFGMDSTEWFKTQGITLIYK